MKKVILMVFFLSIMAVVGFASLEAGSVFAATGYATSTATLIVDSEIALTGCSDINMSPNIGISQDSSVGTTTCTVETSNATGYSLNVKATTSPTMRSGSNSFADYSTSTDPSTWTVGAAQYLFGFSLYGSDVNSSLWGSGTNCGTPGAGGYTANGTMKFFGFDLLATTTASRGTVTAGGGNPTTICVAAEQGDSVNAPSGTYIGTLVFTAVTQ